MSLPIADPDRYGTTVMTTWVAPFGFGFGVATTLAAIRTAAVPAAVPVSFEPSSVTKSSPRISRVMK